MGKRGFLKDALKRKLWPLDYDLDSREYPFQRLQIFYKDKNPDNLIVDLKIREAEYPLKVRIGGLHAVISPQEPRSWNG